MIKDLKIEVARARMGEMVNVIREAYTKDELTWEQYKPIAYASMAYNHNLITVDNYIKELYTEHTIKLKEAQKFNLVESGEEKVKRFLKMP